MELKSKNIIVYPGQNYVNGVSILDKTSMMTYSKIVCCLCSAVIDANPSGICEVCAKKNIDIVSNLPKEFTLIYCKKCDRFNRPPWVKIERESPEMMSYCLSKLKSFNHKIKIIDSSFIYTEPHSKIIKIKVTVQKEVDKNLINQSLIIEYKENWILCRDCQKLQTPHIWCAKVQIRQKVPHKKTFMYLEQYILKNKMQEKAMNIQEVNEGVDFYFSVKRDAEVFTDFISSVVPSKITLSKKYVSLSTTTFTFLVDIANVSKYDIIKIDYNSSKLLGGFGPLIICTRLSSKSHFVDLISFKEIDFDSNTYFRYNFTNFCDSLKITEFLILDVNEEIDYSKKYKSNINLNNNNKDNNQHKKKKRNKRGKKNESDSDDDKKNNEENKNEDESSYGGSSIMSKSTNYQKNGIIERIEFNEKEKERIERLHSIRIKIISNENKEKNNDAEIIEITSFLGDKINVGEIWLGYDLERINLTAENSEFYDSYKDKLSRVILVRKKPELEKGKKLKLKQLDMDREIIKSKGKKNEEERNKEMEDFVEEIYEDNDLKENVEIENEKEEKKIDNEKI
jgi:nonsense-mediated mRNA decay protein 3